jgi:lysophospholipase L1-like esterase
MAVESLDERSATRFVALGDSYTIGTAVDAASSFPVLLAAAVTGLDLVANLGVNGYATRDLIREELPALAGLAPGFVTVLIGANDAVQAVAPRTYRANLATILGVLLARLPANRIVAVSIPDYTVTPHGGDYGDRRQRHDAIVANNTVMAELAAANRIAFVDIFDLSLRAATDRSLVADDGLHPSGVQYALWVERIAPVVIELFAR